MVAGWHIRYLLVLLVLTLAPALPASAATWLTDFGTAKLRVAAENKPMLISFVGSDWCPACQKLRVDVFSKAEFTAFADANLILLEVDFPHSRPLSGAQKQANNNLAQMFRVNAFPTLVLLDTRCQEVARPVYSAHTPGQFIASLQPYLGRPGSGSAAAQPGGKVKGNAELPSPPPPLFNGAPTVPAPRYTGLTLKNISGPARRRFALINNQTFAAGDKARVKVEDREVSVRCLEIRENAVVVMVDGESARQELKLAAAH